VWFAVLERVRGGDERVVDLPFITEWSRTTCWLWVCCALAMLVRIGRLMGGGWGCAAVVTVCLTVSCSYERGAQKSSEKYGPSLEWCVTVPPPISEARIETSTPPDRDLPLRPSVAPLAVAGHTPQTDLGCQVIGGTAFLTNCTA